MLYQSLLLAGMLLGGVSTVYATEKNETHRVKHTEAGKIHGMVYDSSGEPVIGANVYWKDTQQGVVTDHQGVFLLPLSTTSSTIVVSYIGYESHEVTVVDPKACVQVVLSGEVALKEVVVTPPPTGTMHLKLSPFNAQRITAHELGRAACCNLSESFETNPSVDVAYSDAATGAKQIQLLGLSGKYVQMLTEQIPAFTGAASLYGLSYVPGPWMESIQISKGTGSVKNGYEALSGQINVEYKKPQTADKLSVNLFAADNGRVEANSDVNLRINDNLATGILLHYSREMKGHDGNGDGFSDLPRTQQVNLMNRWYYKKEGFISQTVANVLSEQRMSGQMNHDQMSDHPYQVHIRTNRASVYSKNGYLFADEANSSIALMLSGSLHQQESVFGNRAYDVTQKNLYANLVFEQSYHGKHKLSTGLSMNLDHYTEFTDVLNGSVLSLIDGSRMEVIPGGYGQYTLETNDKLVIQAGLRADYFNEKGVFFTPRLHVKCQILPWLTTRVSVGKGYRVSSPLTEYSYLLASARDLRIEEGIDRLEDASNFGVAFAATLPVFGKDLELNAEAYHTRFRNQVVADLDSDAHAAIIRNAAGNSFATIFQLEATYPFFTGFTLTGAFRYTDARTDYAGVMRERYLTSRYKGMLTTSYQSRMKRWQFDLTAQFNGPGRMPDPDSETPLWENNYSAFTVLNGQITRNFRHWSVYLGVENLLDFKQNNPIIGSQDPWGDSFDASMVWGPVHGRKIYGGLRFNW